MRHLFADPVTRHNGTRCACVYSVLSAAELLSAVTWVPINTFHILCYLMAVTSDNEAK